MCAGPAAYAVSERCQAGSVPLSFPSSLFKLLGVIFGLLRITP